MSFDFDIKKIYNNLLEPFKGGDNIVQEGLAIPDIWWTEHGVAPAHDPNNWGNRCDPQPN